jgi:hypothetical protein
MLVKSSSELKLSISYPISSVLVLLSTIAISGVLLPDPGRLESLRRVARPYILTDLRSEGILGSRDCTAEGSKEYSIEECFVGENSAERGRGL